MKARVIALYLPQYHPVKANDEVWGKGFTEWRNVATAKPLFRKHIQPRIPSDLGFYDLRIRDVREQQAQLAKYAGIEGFCYWHYWFGNHKTVLEWPLNDMVSSGVPDFPFCIGWAVHDWTTRTRKKEKTFEKDRLIFKQEFLGKEDDKDHFNYLLNAFKDKRYMKVDGKLLFAIIGADKMPNPKEFFDLWNELAKKNGLPGFHFVAIAESVTKLSLNNLRDLNQTIENNIKSYIAKGFNAVDTVNQKYAELLTGNKIVKIWKAFLRKTFPGFFIEKYNYKKIINHFYSPCDEREDVYPQLLAGWDRSPRSGKRAIIYYNDTPNNFETAVKHALEVVKDKKPEHKIIFLNSWNEWGEGAYVEPDLVYGRKKLDVLRSLLVEKKSEK